MRTLLLSALLLICCATGVLAQAGLTHGIKIGLASSDQDFNYLQLPDELLDPDRLSSYAVGVFIDIPVSNRLGLRPELQFIEKGGQTVITLTSESFPVGYTTVEVKERHRYFSLPVLLRLGTEVDDVGIYVLAGPRMDVEVSTSTGYAALFADDFKKVLFGATVGIGTVVPVFDNAGLLCEFQYHLDFSKAYASETLEVKNNAVCLFLGVRFDAL